MASKFSLLFYGGTYILETGNIVLALTDSRTIAQRAAAEMGRDNETVDVYCYNIHYDSISDMLDDMEEVQNVAGDMYLPFFNFFVSKDRRKAIVNVTGFIIW